MGAFFNFVTRKFIADDPEAQADGTSLYLVKSSAEVTAAESNVLDGATAGTVVASKAVVASASKDVGDFRNLDCQNLDAGADAVAGSVDIFPSTTARGKLTIQCADNTDAHNLILTNAPVDTSNKTVTIPALTGYVALSTAALTLAEVDVLDAVTPGTVAASKAVVVSADKDAGDFRNLDCVNLDAGADAVAGSVDIFPSTTARGKLTIQCADNTDAHNLILTNAPVDTSNKTVTIPALTGYVALSTAALTLAEVDVLDAVTPGTGAASKAVVLDANKAHRIGDWVGSQASGSAVAFGAGLDHYSDGQLDIFSVFGESTADLTSAYSAKCGRFRHLVSCVADTDIAHETYGMIGQLSVKNGSLGHYHAGIMGTFETGTLCHVKTSYCAAAVIARPGGSGTTVESGGLLAGFAAVQNMSAITATGTYAAFATHKTAGGVAWPVGFYVQSGSCTKAIDVTCAAIGATGRIASLKGSIADGNLGDGYGAVELELTATGTLAGQVTGLSNWINIGASAVCGSNKVVAQDNGIWVPTAGAPMASAIAVIGMRMHYIAEGGENPGALHLFDTNIFDNVLTSIFRVNTIVDLGGSTGAQTGNDYKIPFVYDQTAGVTWYLNLYHS